jgi:hypothetical protein
LGSADVELVAQLPVHPYIDKWLVAGKGVEGLERYEQMLTILFSVSVNFTFPSDSVLLHAPGSQYPQWRQQCMAIAQISSVQELESGRSEMISALEAIRAAGNGNTDPLSFLLQAIDDSITLCKSVEQSKRGAEEQRRVAKQAKVQEANTNTLIAPMQQEEKRAVLYPILHTIHHPSSPITPPLPSPLQAPTASAAASAGDGCDERTASVNEATGRRSAAGTV